MKLYFVRHGESEANLLHEFFNRGCKHGLTDRGRHQAATLAQTLRGTPTERQFSSPLLRAVQTAEILANELAAAYEVVDALREYDCGVLEGRSDPTSWSLYTTVQHDWILHRQWDRRIEQGESFTDIRQRFVPFIERLIEDYRHSSSTFVLVGHGGLYRCMLPLVLANVTFESALPHPLTNTGYVLAQLGAEGLECIEWEGQLSLDPQPLHR